MNEEPKDFEKSWDKQGRLVWILYRTPDGRFWAKRPKGWEPPQIAEPKQNKRKQVW